MHLQIRCLWVGSYAGKAWALCRVCSMPAGCFVLLRADTKSLRAQDMMFQDGHVAVGPVVSAQFFTAFCIAYLLSCFAWLCFAFLTLVARYCFAFPCFAFPCFCFSLLLPFLAFLCLSLPFFVLPCFALLCFVRLCCCLFQPPTGQSHRLLDCGPFTPSNPAKCWAS